MFSNKCDNCNNFRLYETGLYSTGGRDMFTIAASSELNGADSSEAYCLSASWDV